MTRPALFSLTTVTHVAAMIQARPCQLQYGWRIHAARLRDATRRIGPPRPMLRSLPADPCLAAHIVLVVAAELAVLEPSWLAPGPHLAAWLTHPADQQWHRLERAVGSPAWSKAAARLRLTAVLTEPYTHYVRQQLAYARAQTATVADPPLKLFPLETHWALIIRRACPPQLLFHLAQFTEVITPSLLYLTPLTIRAALDRGYDDAAIRHWLYTACGPAVQTGDQADTLEEWLLRCRAYRVEAVHLLSTHTPGQLATIVQRRALRRHVQRQLSPRHAVVAADLIPHLRAYLARQNIPLGSPSLPIGDAPLAQDGGEQSGGDPTAWLALRVLQGLQAVTRHHLPRVDHALARHSHGLTAHQLGDLDRQAGQILVLLQEAIAGRDAFVAAEAETDASLLAHLQTAVACAQPVTILYQGLGDKHPRWRTVEPLWLETQGALHYLHAYCRLAAAERRFRLDRIQQSLDADESA